MQNGQTLVYHFELKLKRQLKERKTTDSQVKKGFRVQQSVKTAFWDIKGLTTIDFLVNRAIVNNTSYCQHIWQNSPNLMKSEYIHINQSVYLYTRTRTLSTK